MSEAQTGMPFPRFNEAAGIHRRKRVIFLGRSPFP